MRYRRLDLNLLVALEALLTEKSVTRAAAKLNITQPAMSGALARMREYFEDPLVIQVGRHMELTPYAQSLVAPIHDIIMRIDSAIATEPAFDPTHSQRHFSMTVSDYVIRVVLQNVLIEVHREAPGITFEFRQSSARVQDELESGEVDFVIGPEIDVLPEHPHEVLFEDTYTVIAWAESTVVGDTLTFDEYLALRHVMFRNASRGVPSLERWFSQRYGEVRQIDVAAQSFDLLPYLVVGSDRIATIPSRLAQLFVKTLPLKTIAPPIELPVLTEILQWNVHRDPDPASRWLRTKIKEHAARLQPI
jgi:LysR family transcriptional regulator, nod-box dependent transcriptional activator